MPRELNVISQPGSSSGGDACTYMWACAICDENETCQKDKEGHSRLARRQAHGTDRIQSVGDEQ